MANSLGGLIVTLGLNAAEFTTGLTKAEFEAKKFAARLDHGIAVAAGLAAAGISLMTAAAVASAKAFDSLAKEAARFKDLEEITGASAESLASFAVAAKVAGTDMNTVASASVKLTKSLTGVDDESKAAGAALAALGINIKEFKQLDPATQIDVIAKALAGFQDGAAKTAVALALFGKAGAELLPFLKELGDGIGRQTILTQQQIEAADKYADAQARATATLNLYLQVLATQALPALTAFTNAAKDAIKELVGLDESSSDLAGNDEVRKWSERSVVGLGFVISSAEGAVRVFQILGETILGVADIRSKALTLDFKGALEASKALNAEINRLLNKPLFSDRIAAEIQKIRDTEKFPGETGGRRREKPVINFDGAAKNAKALKEQTSEADRYLESLQKQLEKTLELTVVQQVSLDIENKRIKGLTPDLERQILAVAGQIDAYHRLKEEIQAINKAFEEEVRANERASKVLADQTKAANDNADAVLQGNERLRDEIAIILGGEFARRALENDYLANTITRKENALAIEQQIKGHEGIAEALRIEIDGLKERQGLLAGRGVAEQLARDAKNLQDFKNIFADSAANAFTDFITGAKTAKDAFKDFVSSVNRQISQIASQNIANAIFGGKNGEGFDLSRIVNQLTGGLIGTPAPTTAAAGAVAGAAGETATAAAATALTGSAGTLTASGAVLDSSGVALTASSGAMDAAAAALTGAAGALSSAAVALGGNSAVSSAGGVAGLFAKLFSSGAGGGVGVGDASQGLAAGTDFARGGLTLVGERGPEIVNLPAGSKVTANDQIGKLLNRPNLSIVVNVPQGTSGPSADQIGIRVGAHVQRALARNG